MNFLVILGDHLRHDVFGHTDCPLARTPNIDALGARSTRFGRCFNQSPVCSPARHSINTGQYAHRHGVLGNFVDPYEGLTTIAHALGPAGYRCIHRGHMHWRGEQPNGYHPDAPGLHWVDYDDWHSTMPKWALDRYYQENAFHIRRQTGGPSSRKPEHYTGHYVTQRTIADMTSAVRAGEPFLAFAAFSEPHPPFYPPAEHYRRLNLSDIDLPASVPEGASVHPLLEKRHREWEHLTDVEVRQMIAGYHGLVSLMDDYVGQLLSTLEQLGVADETAIIFSADHGDQLWEHGVFLKFITREASVRVPLMIHLPGQDGASRDELVEHVDLFPTLCDLAGAPTPETVQGRSLTPLLAGQSPADWRDMVFSEIDDEAGHITMARTDRWKLNLYDEGPDELFDLAEDPQEFHNLIDEPARADTVSTLRGRIATWRQATAPGQGRTGWPGGGPGLLRRL